MTIQEFSTEFDLMYNNITSSQSPGLDEYEKSVFLTHEQDGLVTALYTGAGSYGGFELTEQMRRSLDSLLVSDVLEPIGLNYAMIASNSTFFELDDSLWYIVYEAAKYKGDGNEDKKPCQIDARNFPVEIVPATYDEFHRIKGDPFRGPSKRRALRFDVGIVDGHRVIEVVSKDELSKYFVKYIRHPQPIILEKLTDNTINKKTGPLGCELHESLHRIILDSAVRAAKAAYVGAAS